MSTIEDAVCSIAASENPFVEVDGDFSVSELRQKLEEIGFLSVEIDRAPVRDKEMLMHALYQSLRFPGYFGFTWDSLKDVLTALDGAARAQRFVLLFNDLSMVDQKTRDHFIEVVEEANQVREHCESLEKLMVVTLRS